MANPTARMEATAIHLPDLRGGTALVTGASRGIGRAVVEALAAHDVHCFGLADQGFAADLPPQVEPIPCDLSDARTIEQVLAKVTAQTESLDYLVNVAGIDPKYRLEEGTVENWDSVVDLNLRAYYLLIRGCLPLLRRGGGRSIVNVSSINYRLGIIGRSIYSGFGGQVDFVRGAARSKGGKPIIALPSTARGGTVSRIVDTLAEGSGVVTTRADVHYVVTEYGIASLYGKSLRERAEELIAVAHPDFRSELRAAALGRKLCAA